jgi:hypothetical protein
MLMSDDYIPRIKQFLRRHRIETYRFEKRAKHRAVVVAFRGKSTTIFFPGTGSDRRGPANTVSNLRRALGLVGS